MSTYSRDDSLDRAESRVVKHQHSFSESGRSSVPMWDSSDPDRAPPPLPLNPGGPGSPITRSNTSKRIDEAAALITARARENAPSSYTTNPLPPTSPDRSIMRAQNRRMQNLQSPSVSRLSDSLERRSPDKGLRSAKFVDFEDLRSSRSPERSPARHRSDTPTPDERRGREVENTPPTPNMLALQSMRNRQDAAPLSDITNGASTPLQPIALDSLSSQILSLTNIVTNVQQEMSSLNKRSKDNYSDLMSLKQAASSRDEDIRTNLRDLVAGLETKLSSLDTRLLSAPETTRSAPNLGGLYLDDKAHNATPRKSFGLPRIGSPTSFSVALERELTASPSLACVDGAASIALLEKVLREMATREGQDKIMTTLEAVKSQAHVRQSVLPAQTTIDPTMMSKLEDILMFMKDMKEESGSRALVRSMGNESGKRTNLDHFLEDNNSLAKAKSGDDRRASLSGSDAVTEEVVKTLKNVKQSLAQGGGLTNEVKVLVRELRGEVLGMGREIGRKLEQTATPNRPNDAELQVTLRNEVVKVVQQGLVDLKDHVQRVVEESSHRSLEMARPANDVQEIVRAVSGVLADLPRPREQPVRDVAAEREDILAAVREAWEDCKPEIALEHFGLERDEILETLKEGLKSYQPQQNQIKDAAISYEDVLEAVRKALEDYKPPVMPAPAGISQEDVFTAVRQCLDGFEWPNMPAAQTANAGLSRDDVVDAIKESMAQQENASRDLVADVVKDALSRQELPVAKEVEFNREDLFDAIRACLEGEQNPLGGMGERVVEAMHEFLGSMRTEFQQYSAASGKDTEQVLDALKDGLEDLRADIESYVDRAADVTGKDEIIDTVKAGFAAMQADVDKGFANRANGAPNTPDLLDAMEKEFEHLRETMSKSMSRTESPLEKDEILDAIRDLSDDRQSALSSNSEDIVRLVKEELEHMRTTLAGTLMKSGSSLDRDEVLDVIREGLEASRSAPRMDGSESILSNTSELLDAFQDGVDGIRSEIQKLKDRPIDVGASEEVLDALKVGIEDVRADISRLAEKQTESSEPGTRGQELVVHDQNHISSELEGLKVMITQLRIKVEALDGMAAPPMPTEVHIHKDDMNEICEAIQQAQDTVSRPGNEETRIHKDDMDGIYTSIREVHDAVKHVRDATPPEAVIPENVASKEDTDAIETLLRNVKAKLDEFLSDDSEPLARSSQLDAIEFTLSDLKTAVEECTARAGEQTNKEDFTIIELMLKDVQSNVEDFKSKLDAISPQDESINKNEFQLVETLCMDIKSQIEAIKLPDVEGLSTKTDLEDVRNDLKSFREQFEADNGLTAQAFEARKIEHGGLATKIDDVKNVIGDLRDELINRVEGSADGIVELNKVLGMHHDDMSKYATASNLEELAVLIKTEFDRHMEHHSASKAEMEERDATLFSKHDDTNADIKTTVEDRFTELMTKYDDAQHANEAKLSALEERDSAHLDATTGTKAVVDDLKSLMDVLGSTVTETSERISEDSKTVFTSIEDSNAKLESLHSANAFEHGVTREEVAKTLASTTRLEGTVSEHHPAVLAAIREVMGVVSQHYEHSQQQTESFARATEEIKSGVDSIPAAIPPLLPALPAVPAAPVEPTTPREIPVYEKYDDSEVHDKLDNLLSHASLAKEVFAGIENHQKDTRDSLAGLSKLDEVHAQIMATAAEIASMVTTQARLMGEHHDSKAAEATEAAIALEKRTAQKEKVEADIVALSQEKNALVESMANLKREQEELSGQTKRLTREVAKLETALQFRQEEIRDMNARAEVLERRVLEGLVNQARSVRPPKPMTKTKISPSERDASMNLKRVPSQASTATAQTSIRSGTSAIGSAVGMALKKRGPLTSNVRVSTTPRTSAVDRRILSTSHVTGNRGRNTPDMALMLAPVPKSTGLVSLKRSHSVKSNPSSYLNGRNASWNVVSSEVTDKENLSVHEDSGDEYGSDASTERRTSMGTSLMYTDSMTYGTGSSLSSHSRRSGSCASSIAGMIDGQADSIAEEDEEQEQEEETGEDTETAMVLHDMPTEADPVNAGQDNTMALTTFDGLETPMSDLQPPPVLTGQKLKYHHGSDSGLGTEPLTAGTEQVLGEAQEYFQMTAQDMHL
ncbi:hypothetical protein PV11_07229 [Exophiala sideris]|uniref:Chromosome segregation ATPase family protein n=1 Tax=Exophiala sideris TaxID=1016849 RepID=A0A0D1Y9P8_9EURO|nr:hypothetical protein PV11_07229 [Exophiala sideris]